MKRSFTLLVLLFISLNACATEALPNDFSKCTEIVNKAKRLECFDLMAGTPKYEEAAPSRFVINKVMAPTCYIAAHGAAACGPTHACNAKETGIKSIEGKEFACYIMGSTPNCCTYCPSEWSGNC